MHDFMNVCRPTCVYIYTCMLLFTHEWMYIGTINTKAVPTNKAESNIFKYAPFS